MIAWFPKKTLNNLSQKIGSLDWRPGPGKVGQKIATHPTCDAPHRESHTQNETKVFFNLN